jgi:hypothetical protein
MMPVPPNEVSKIPKMLELELKQVECSGHTPVPHPARFAMMYKNNKFFKSLHILVVSYRQNLAEPCVY